MSNKQIIRAGALCGLAGAILLALMAVLGFSSGDGLGAMDLPAEPAAYAAALRPAAPGVIRVLAVDNIFLIAYTGAFIGAAALVWQKARVFGVVGLAAALLTALLDIIENAISVDTARTVLADLPVTLGRIHSLGVLAQVKYASAAAAVVFFAVALVIVSPGGRRLSRGVAVLFGLFPVANALAVINPAGVLLVVGWMFMMLVASAVLLWRSANAVA